MKKILFILVLGITAIIYFHEKIEKIAKALYFTEKTKVFPVVGLCLFFLAIILVIIAEKSHEKNPYTINALRDFSKIFAAISLFGFIVCLIIPLFIK